MGKLVWLVPTTIIFSLIMFYIIHHDFAVEAEQLVDSWSCEKIEYWLEWEGKKIINNLFTPQVQKQYEVKCIGQS